MTARREARASDSPLVECITQVTYEGSVREWSTPDGCWDIVVMQRAGRTTVLQTALISRPVLLAYDAGDSYLAIAMEGETLEVPRLENAEGLVDRLARRGLLVRDELVESAAAGRPRAISPRSMP
jgi:hypothetical protein